MHYATHKRKLARKFEQTKQHTPRVAQNQPFQGQDHPSPPHISLTTGLGGIVQEMVATEAGETIPPHPFLIGK